MKTDGMESWVVTSRGIERYVTEHTLDHVDSMRVYQYTESSG